ncbi:hypothetical protein J6590_029732 [Homalodisca vitripennis]|nr:hypothetical protein J6590_029732 [Homalodisca vitripennis]
MNEIFEGTFKNRLNEVCGEDKMFIHLPTTLSTVLEALQAYFKLLKMNHEISSEGLPFNSIWCGKDSEVSVSDPADLTQLKATLRLLCGLSFRRWVAEVTSEVALL